ncbi:MAG: thiamine pyrophosphate-binding protein, partial [Lachnospiraceae bacterium]|nr:thiamine pyrophosphate-binding protein [Lachnospiraceae bacterium]
VIFAGYGVRLSGSAELLLEAVRKLRIPVQLAWNSGDLVAYDNPYYAGSPSREGTRGSAFNIQNADCLLVLGSRMNIRTVTYNRHDFAKNAYKIMVDIDPDELEKPTFVPDMKVCGDVKKFLEALLACDYTPNPDHEKWVRFCRDELERYPAVLPEYHRETGKINPYVFLEKLSGQLSDHEVLTLGNASACVMTFSALKIRQGMRMFTNSGCAAMGYGLPAALGVAVSDPTRRTVCIDGDGSLMMNVQELAVIAHNRMNVKLFVIDNAGYHSIRQTQSNLFKGRSFVGIGPASGVGFPDFRLLAEAFGFAYRLVETEPGAEDVIRDALSLDGPVFIQVKVDETQNFVPKLSSRVLPDGSIVSPSLDDMYPFLSREEYERNRFYLC